MEQKIDEKLSVPIPRLSSESYIWVPMGEMKELKVENYKLQ